MLYLQIATEFDVLQEIEYYKNKYWLNCDQQLNTLTYKILGVQEFNVRV